MAQLSWGNGRTCVRNKARTPANPIFNPCLTRRSRNIPPSGQCHFRAGERRWLLTAILISGRLVLVGSCGRRVAYLRREPFSAQAPRGWEIQNARAGGFGGTRRSRPSVFAPRGHLCSVQTATESASSSTGIAHMLPTAADLRRKNSAAGRTRQAADQSNSDVTTSLGPRGEILYLRD